MSCCPGIKCRNTGSGYVKPEGRGGSGGGAASEIDARMKDLLAARAADDARIWGKPELQTVSSKSSATSATSTKPSNTITYH